MRRELLKCRDLVVGKGISLQGGDALVQLCEVGGANDGTGHGRCKKNSGQCELRQRLPAIKKRISRLVHHKRDLARRELFLCNPGLFGGLV